MKLQLQRSALISVLALAAGVGAHRNLPSGITCGSQFSSPDTPLVIPNAAISWANYGIFTCDDPVMWYEAAVDENQPMYFTFTVPEIERFRDTRMAVVFLGPGLPALDANDVSIPEDIMQYASENGLGGIVIKSPDDQSSCAHLTSDLMIQESFVKNDRCHFYEPFSGSNMWVVMDDELIAPASGTYKIAAYEQNGNTAKASFACCDWPEDFITPYDIPEPTCEACGTSPENPAWTSLYFEQKSMADFGGYPPLQNCAADATPIALPEGDKCPPIPSFGGNIIQQPASCALGCSSNGECHSHNVFGECTHSLDWTLEPKFGEASVNRIVIFKGDKIRFTHEMEDGLAHNLFELSNESALDTCDFSGSTNLAGVEEIKIGHDVTFDQAGEFHFTCSIGCSAPIEGGPEFDASEGQDTAFCHCSIGQKLTVEVKDATDGLRCHSHPQTTHDHGSTRRRAAEAVALECPMGTENARAVNNPVYGATSDSECAEQCAPAIAISFMSGVELGSCVDLGFIYGETMTTVQPPGSPAAVEVRITSNVDSGMDEGSMPPADGGMEQGGAFEEEKSDCHCHSYEEIVCPEAETEEDTLYAEHIEEIEEYCQGILDGSETDCPYKCFQPMEVLHLHYLECPSRVIDPTYIAINATDMCHIAATAPEGTEVCPVVELPNGASNNNAPANDLVDNDGEDDDKPSLSAGAIAGIVIGSLAAIGIVVFLAASSSKGSSDSTSSPNDKSLQATDHDLSQQL